MESCDGSIVVNNATTPRLSVLVPFVDDVAAFEDSLLSVLENRPSASEVIVVHDGSYTDPFQLGDVVRFAIGDTTTLVDAIATGCDAAWGRYVHVVSDGDQATEGWTESALEKFEDFDIAAVALHQVDCKTNETASLGWLDSATRLMVPNQQPRLAKGGVYLHASIWRRDVLRSLTRACAANDLLTASYAYGMLCREGRWRFTTSEDSRIQRSPARSPWNRAQGGVTGFSRGRKLRQIRNYFGKSTRMQSVFAGLRGIASGGVLEALGQLFADDGKDLDRIIERSHVYRCDEPVPTSNLQVRDRVAA